MSELLFSRLIALDDDVQPHEITLDREVHTVGRSVGCDIVIARNLVSRLHARIERVGPRYHLVDAGSANGTFINGVLLSGPHLLADRDTIGLGEPIGTLRFVDPDPTAVPLARLRYDERTMSFVLAGQALELTPNQFRLLHFLYQQRGQVCPRETCAQAVWGRDYDPGLDADALDRLVSNVRGAIRRVAPELDLLQTRRGLGYLLDVSST